MGQTSTRFTLTCWDALYSYRARRDHLGSAIFAFLAAGIFKTVEEAQLKICPPDPDELGVYERLYAAYRKLYFSFGEPQEGAMGDVLPTLIQTAGAAGGT